jgi:hypothetical protein
MVRYLAQPSFLSGLLAISTLAWMAPVGDQPALAQTGPHSCSLLTSAQSTPQGFGAVYNLFSAARELLLNVECGSSSSATLTVGNGQQTLYIYRFAYEWIDNQWKQIALSGSQLAGNEWYIGTASASLFRSQQQLSENNFVVAYTCSWVNNTWKCGCRDQHCSTNFWQLQGFTQRASSEGSSAVGSGSKIPAATRTVNVSNPSQLSSAILNAQPGDHIILANGTYSGFTISRSGRSSEPIVIRGANLHGAKLTGGITVSGDFVWIVGMDLGDNTLSVEGNDNRVTRNLLTAAEIDVTSSARRAEIDHNELRGGNTSDNKKKHGVDIAQPCGSSLNHHVYRNYFHDSTGGSDRNVIVAGNLGGQFCSISNSIVEYNLIENWEHGSCLSTKGGGTTFQFNTCSGNRNEGPRVRQGDENKFIANWIESRNGLRIYRYGNVVIGNRFIGGPLRISSGNCDAKPDEQVTKVCDEGYVPATNTLVVGNVGPIEVGFNFSGYDTMPARSTRIEAHDGSMKFGKHVGTTQAATTNRIVPEAFKLLPSQVGPNAPTAPK